MSFVSTCARVIALTGCLAVGLGGLASSTRAAEAKLPTIDKVTEGYSAQHGFFHLYRKKQRLLLEVPRMRIGRPFLLATSVSGGSALAGWQWNDALVEWQRLDDKLLLVEKNVQYRAKKGDPLSEVVQRTYTDRLIKAVRILAEQPGSPRRGVLIDANELFGRYASAFFGRLARALDPSVIRISEAKVFPKNVELALTMPSREDGSMVTLHYSMTELPPGGYTPRPADDRVGYFVTAIKDFSKPGSGDRFVRYINRWRLEKADPSLKISPPKRPIVFYIEKSVPVRYRRFVRDGILAWNDAFEKIGFTGAIVVRQQTEDNEFAGLDPEDARYSFFRWITSESAFAMGPSRVNPTTGEIFDADIIFDDAMVRSYLRDYELMLKRTPGAFFTPEDRKYFSTHPKGQPLFAPELMEANALAPSAIERALMRADRSRGLCTLGQEHADQLALADLALLVRGAKKAEEPWPEEFLGAMIKEVVMHEVGHTLGLRHNFVASTMLDLDKINSENGPKITGGSVMDYNPVNVAKPEQHQGAYITQGLGPYDYWAIEYGYKPVKSQKELLEIAKKNTRPELAYATDEDAASPDPYVNRFDLGSDPLAYAKQQVEVARWLLSNVDERVIREGDSYARLRRAVDMLLFDVLRAGMLAGRFIGGERYFRNHKGDPDARAPIEAVPGAKQREALEFICNTILTVDAFQLRPELLKQLGSNRWSHWGMEAGSPSYGYGRRVARIQTYVLAQVLSPSRLERLADQALKAGDSNEVLRLGELVDTLTGAIFAELEPEREVKQGQPFVHPLRRNLQRIYLEWLIDEAVDGGGPPILRALALERLESLREALARVLSEPAKEQLDAESRAHLRELAVRTKKALDASVVVPR